MTTQREEWLNSPQVKKFSQELEELKIKLSESGKRWFSLNLIEEQGGEIKVYLNPYDQKIYNYGWFTLQDLRNWLSDEGSIVMEAARLP